MKDEGIYYHLGYIQENYIKKYKIDRKKLKIKIYYLSRDKQEIPYDSQSLFSIRSKMHYQYQNYTRYLKRGLFINRRIKKQKYYMDHSNAFSSYTLKNYKLDKYLKKGELRKMKKSKEETDSYFNLSSVGNYKIKTLKKITSMIKQENKYNSRKKTLFKFK